jgi:cytochrome P450
MQPKALTLDLRKPINLSGREFTERKYEYYPHILEEAPIALGKIAVVKTHLLSRYDDCMSLLKDPRFVRNRSTATGGRRSPIPLPKSLSLLAQSMIVEDDPEHRRLRSLVSKAFTPRAVANFETRIQSLSHELLDHAEKNRGIDLIEAYAQPIPMAVIAQIVGVSDEDIPQLKDSVMMLSNGFTGWSLLRTIFLDMPAGSRFIRMLIARKRADPQDDILTALVHAEENGDSLSEDEVVAFTFLLIIAGFETTTHLISNSVLTLLQNPDQLERLRAEPELFDSAVEELLRHRGPVHGTKLAYAMEDVTLHGVTIRRGESIIPLLGAANHDPEVFEKPEVFDIARAPNRHVSFGFGPHFCLGAQLARMETKIALQTLLDRNPNLRLAVPAQELTVQRMPLWHRYERMPVVLG